MPRVSLDPMTDPNPINEPGTTIAGDPYFDNSPGIPNISPTNPYYGIDILVEPLDPIEPIAPIDVIDPAVPIQNNPSNPINILIEPIRENVVSVNESPITVENPSVATTTNQPSTATTATTTISSVPPKPNTAIMGGGGGKTGTTSVGSDVKKTDKKYWWWIAVAVVGVGLYSYKKSK
jgi:hypothetical protein